MPRYVPRYPALLGLPEPAIRSPWRCQLVGLHGVVLSAAMAHGTAWPDVFPPVSEDTLALSFSHLEMHMWQCLPIEDDR